MQIFKHQRFSQWAKAEGITDATLKAAVEELVQGLFDANLGGGLYKKRVARRGQGKRGAYRTLVAFQREDRSVFVFGFAKKERANLSKTQLVIYKRLAKDYLQATNNDIQQLIRQGILTEVRG